MFGTKLFILVILLQSAIVSDFLGTLKDRELEGIPTGTFFNSSCLGERTFRTWEGVLSSSDVIIVSLFLFSIIDLSEKSLFE